MRSEMFSDRIEAGRRLGDELLCLASEDVVVLGLPRGGVPVAAKVAERLEAPLDVIVVRKLGVPSQPELAMGAIGEDGVRVENRRVMRLSGVTERQLAKVERSERAELERRAAAFRGGRPMIPIDGRTVVIVDDGIATGSTARAACEVARAHGAAKVVLAAPVAPHDWAERLGDAADEYVAVLSPRNLVAIGQWYADFRQTPDDEVVAHLERLGTRASPRAVVVGDVEIAVDGVSLPGRVVVPRDATGIVLFAHGTGSSRLSPRNAFVAGLLNRAGIGTVLFDLLTPDEEEDRMNVFDIAFLGARLEAATRWVRSAPGLKHLNIGYFGASTGAAAAVWAATRPRAAISAVVSRGGRPDLAEDRLSLLTAPTRLIVGERDTTVLELNREAAAVLQAEHDVVVIPGATHLFEEPGTLELAGNAAREWFAQHLGAVPPARRNPPPASQRVEGTGFDPGIERAREDAEGVDVFTHPYASRTQYLGLEEAQGQDVFESPDVALPPEATKEGEPGQESLVYQHSASDEEDHGSAGKTGRPEA